jgi:hypothetical protein
MESLAAVWSAFDKAFRDHRQTSGVRTVPFWRLGLSEHFPHDPDQLRETLAHALTRDSLPGVFDERCIPAFLLWVQTQATGHSYRLWEETVIPLLAGSGEEGKQRQDRLRQTFNGEHPFRSALRAWLTHHGRAAEYTKGENYHFWFVRAVIGECALVWVRNDFVADFFSGSLVEWARKADSRASAEARFAQLHASYGTVTEISRDELGSIAALKECLVEAGTRLSALARLACGQLPPVSGWTVASLLDRAKSLLGLTLSDLPRAVVEVLRARLEVGMASLNLEQLVAFFRRYPESVFTCPGGTWTLRTGSPPPIARGTLVVGDGVARPATLVDDLGRGPDELLAIIGKNGERWYEDDGVRWRVSLAPFHLQHPSCLRASARPVLRNSDSLTHPGAWAWTGAVPGSPGQADAAKPSAALEPTGSGSLHAGRRRLHLFAWPALDEELLPCLFLFRFRYAGDEAARVTLLRDGELEPLWSGLSSDDWIPLRLRVPATAGGTTRIRATEVAAGVSRQVEELKFRWPCPALFAAGRRLIPGQHLIPGDGKIVLITAGTPEIRGGQLRLINSQHRALAGASLYEVVPEGQTELSIAAEGERWRIEPRHRLLIRLRLVQETSTGPDGAAYTFDEPGVRVFFSAPPLLQIHVSLPQPSADPEPDVVWDFVKGMRLTVGGAMDPEPAIRVALDSLRDSVRVTSSGSELCLSVPLRDFVPVDLLEPGFDVRRVALNGWFEMEGEGNPVGVTGHGERFVILPYTRARVIPRTPGRRGGVTLEDASGLYHPLELLESLSDEIPGTGQCRIDRVPLSATLPLSGLRLETRVAIPLLGAWFWRPEWNLQDLAEYVRGVDQPCVRVIPPEGDARLCATVTVEQPDGVERTIARDELVVSGCADLLLAELLPAGLRSDHNLQSIWLSNPASTIRLGVGEHEAGRVVLDLRPHTTAFRLLRQHEPAATGRTTVEVEAEIIPGFLSDRTLAVHPVRRDASRTPEGSPVVVSPGGPGWAPAVIQCSVDLVEPGEYRLELRRAGDGSLAASLDVTAHAPAAPTPDLKLVAFLESWPEGEPTLANVLYLFRFIRCVPDPWAEFSLYTTVARARDAIRDRMSLCYRLVDSLRGYLEEPPEGLTRVDLVEPESVPPAVIAEVGTVAMHVQLQTDEPLRVGLSRWEEVFNRAAHETARPLPERDWLRVLGRIARLLRGQSVPSQGHCQKGDTAPGTSYYPSRPEFLAMIAGIACSTSTE